MLLMQLYRIPINLHLMSSILSLKDYSIFLRGNLKWGAKIWEGLEFRSHNYVPNTSHLWPLYIYMIL